MNALDIALAAGRRFVDGHAVRSVAPLATAAEVRAKLPDCLPDGGLPAARVIEWLVSAGEDGLIGNNAGRFFAWVKGGALPAAQAADVLASLWDQNAVLAACSPTSAAIEEVAGRLLLDALHLPAACAYSFTTGCQMSHATALAAARHHVLAAAGWDVERQGLFGAPPIRVLANANRHGSTDRALRLIGIGTDAIVPLGSAGRVGPAELATALAAAPGQPTILCLNAADLSLGVSDDFATLVPMAQAAGAWVHVDGAFGLWLAASPRFAHLVAGIDLADSWATDGHKWLNTPYDCGMAITRHPAALKAAMRATASYLTQADDGRDPMDFTPEWSRRARAMPVLAALLELGRRGIADLIDRCCGHALAIHDGIAALPGATSIARPVSNQGMIAFHDQAGTNISDAVIAAINASGEAFFSGGLWQGQRVMRISVCNWQTSADDVRRTITATATALAAMRAVHPAHC
jgi:aromatic-L-amino-acid decarboxylase